MPVFRAPVVYVIMAQSSGNSDRPKQSRKVPPVSEKVKVLDLIRHFILSRHHRKEDECSTIRYFETTFM